MVVKTYPSPSRKYGEITCTAGIRLSDGEWVRIYPYPFRLLDMDYRFAKYDILELPLERALADPRPESYRLVDPMRIKKVGHIPPSEGWSERMRYIRPKAWTSLRSFEEQLVRRLTHSPQEGMLLDLGEEKGVGRGKIVWGKTIAAVRVLQASAKVHAEYVGEDWPPEEKRKLQSLELLQQGLFESQIGKPTRMLRFSPYKFYLEFQDIEGNKRKKPITDWEIYQLYFREEQRLRSRDSAIESVRRKIESDIFGSDKETWVVVGSIHHRYARKNLYAVIGFIWPKRQALIPLF